MTGLVPVSLKKSIRSKAFCDGGDPTDMRAADRRGWPGQGAAMTDAELGRHLGKARKGWVAFLHTILGRLDGG